MKKALAAAWLAAVVVHTSLTEPALTNPAIELFERRERDAFLELTRQAEGVWTGDAGTGSDETALLRDDPAVHAAFEAPSAPTGSRSDPAPDVTLVPGATVRAQRVVLEPHLQCAWRPDGVRFIRGISLPALIALAPRVTQVPDL